MKKEDERKTKVVVDIFCDVCGSSVIPDTHKQNEESLNDFSAYGQLKAEFGYGSTRDGDKVSLDLCEKCFDKLLQKADELKSQY